MMNRYKEVGAFVIKQARNDNDGDGVMRPQVLRLWWLELCVYPGYER
jgi:hypothetical protein